MIRNEQSFQGLLPLLPPSLPHVPVYKRERERSEFGSLNGGRRTVFVFMHKNRCIRKISPFSGLDSKMWWSNNNIFILFCPVFILCDLKLRFSASGVLPMVF